MQRVTDRKPSVRIRRDLVDFPYVVVNRSAHPARAPVFVLAVLLPQPDELRELCREVWAGETGKGESDVRRERRVGRCELGRE